MRLAWLMFISYIDEIHRKAQLQKDTTATKSGGGGAKPKKMKASGRAASKVSSNRYTFAGSSAAASARNTQRGKKGAVKTCKNTRSPK